MGSSSPPDEARPGLEEPHLEAIEALDLAYARFNSVRSLRVPDPELTVERIGDLSVLRDPSRPEDETYNRILGLREASLPALDEALARFTTAPQVDVPIDVCSPALLAGLAERGLAARQVVIWLAAAPEAMPDVASPPDVRRLHPEDAGRFLDLLGSGGDPVSDAVRAKRQRYYCTTRFEVFVATIDDVPLGWATLFVDGDRGVLGNAFTFPAQRRRGAQRALFAARAAHARDRGLRWIVTDVAPDTASYRNAVRAGLARRSAMMWFRRSD